MIGKATARPAPILIPKGKPSGRKPESLVVWVGGCGDGDGEGVDGGDGTTEKVVAWRGRSGNWSAGGRLVVWEGVEESLSSF